MVKMRESAHSSAERRSRKATCPSTLDKAARGAWYTCPLPRCAAFMVFPRLSDPPGSPSIIFWLSSSFHIPIVAAQYRRWNPPRFIGATFWRLRLSCPNLRPPMRNAERTTKSRLFTQSISSSQKVGSSWLSTLTPPGCLIFLARSCILCSWILDFGLPKICYLHNTPQEALEQHADVGCYLCR